MCADIILINPDPMPYIKTIPYEKADSDLKLVYDEIINTRGKLAEVHKIQSLNPEALTAHMDLYMTVMFGKSPLQRYQREMMGIVVSVENDCDYCINHHEQALLAYWKDEQRTEHLRKNREKAELSNTDKLLCKLAEHLTRNSGQEVPELITQLKDTGLADRAILDAVQVISYFNFVNRLVTGLGVTYNEEEIKGYNY